MDIVSGADVHLGYGFRIFTRQLFSERHEPSDMIAVVMAEDDLRHVREINLHLARVLEREERAAEVYEGYLTEHGVSEPDDVPIAVRAARETGARWLFDAHEFSPEQFGDRRALRQCRHLHHARGG